MEYIDKCNEGLANPIIDAYLQTRRGRWSESTLYREFCGAQKHDIIDNVLLPEQDNKCCYCLKTIADHCDDATIEHIIPQSTTSFAQAQHYYNGRPSRLNARNVCLTADFLANNETCPPYPHRVAYHNMTVACDRCNNKRDSNEIEPLFLYNTIHDEVSYDKGTGKVFWECDPGLIPTVETVGLNDPIMRAIRVTWFYIDANNLQWRTMTRSELLYGALGYAIDHGCNDLLKALMDLDTDTMWVNFVKYEYFLHI